MIRFKLHIMNCLLVLKFCISLLLILLLYRSGTFSVCLIYDNMCFLSVCKVRQRVKCVLSVVFDSTCCCDVQGFC